MPSPVSHEHAQKSRAPLKLFNGTTVWLSTYIGDNVALRKARGANVETPAEDEDDSLYPMAYLVEQEPNSSIHPHFHKADQFQLFVRGHGTFGRKPVEGCVLHYANSFTTYGPIVSAGDGLDYLTLRNGWDAGASWMPQSRDKLKDAGPRVRTHEFADVSGAPIAGASSYEFFAHDTGLAAWLYHLDRDEEVVGLSPRNGRGQYWVVLDGEISFGGESGGPLSCLFLPEQEEPLSIRATKRGTAVIAMQFPRQRPVSPASRATTCVR